MDLSFLFSYSVIFLFILARYMIIAGIFFLLYYVLFKEKWSFKKIQQKFPKSKDYQREVLYSICTIAIFAGIGVLVFLTPLKEYTQIYESMADYGWGYWFFSIVLMTFLHDTYFYWAHRAMHHKKLYKLFHLVHHKSTNPSPWAAYAFHPLEGVVEASIVFLIVFLMPFHITALMAFLILTFVYNVYGHLGYELYPKNFHKTTIGRWVNTSIHHNMHHKYFEGNYGLYFLFWDRWMGTLREESAAAFEEVTERSLVAVENSKVY